MQRSPSQPPLHYSPQTPPHHPHQLAPHLQRSLHSPPRALSMPACQVSLQLSQPHFGAAPKLLGGCAQQLFRQLVPAALLTDADCCKVQLLGVVVLQCALRRGWMGGRTGE
eukprot:351828-Chlamydomonas_euryale.AAC.6